MLSVVLLSILMILLSTLSVIRHLIWSVARTRIGFWTWTLSARYWTGGSGLLISILEKVSWFCLTGVITDAINVKMYESVFQENHLLRCWSELNLLNWIGVLTLSLLLKLPLRKLVPWFVLWFFSPEVTLYLYKSTICQCMEYCCLVWAWSTCAPSCYLELLNKLQKRICRAVAVSLATSLKSLTYCWNVASLILFYRYYFRRCSFELAQLVPLPYPQGRSTCHYDRLHDFCHHS